MRTEVLLLNYGERSDENARRAREELFGVQNSRKAEIGRLAGLPGPGRHEGEAAAEKRPPRRRRCRFPAPRCASAWDEVAAALKTLRGIRKELTLLEAARPSLPLPPVPHRQDLGTDG